MAKNYLDYNGLGRLWNKIKALVSTKADASHSHSVATTSANGFMSSSDKSKLNGIASGANKTTVDSALSSSSTNPVQNKVINTALSGKSDTGHTHDKTTVSSFYEANLEWGGKNHAASFAPIDAAMIPELGANRLAFMPADAVIVEYSTNGGSTWSNYEASNAQKIKLFNGQGNNFFIGANSSTGIDKSNHMVRVTVNTGAANVYTALNKFAIYCTTNGSSNCYCSIQGRLQSNYTAGTETWVTFVNKVPISGWSGWNIINTTGIVTYGNSSTVQYGQVRFTFGVTSHGSSVTYGGLCINKILGFGGVGWTTPSNMAKYGRMYTYDENQNVTFPAIMYAPNGGFVGSLRGNVTGSATTITDTLPITKGGTGATTAAGALTNLGITATAAELNKMDGVTATTTELNYVDGVTSNIQTQLNGKAASSHTHNYAGASSAGGAATSANKLNTDAGSLSQPVYFAGGIPIATRHTLEASVPSDAKFTDTTYSAATTSAAGLMSAADKTKLNGIATGANAYSLPTASSSTLGGVKTTSTVTSTSGLTPCPIISGVPYYKNTTYSLSGLGGVGSVSASGTAPLTLSASKSGTAVTITGSVANASTSGAGLMSASDKVKLNGIATGANKITKTSELTNDSDFITRTQLNEILASLNIGFVATEAEMNS